MSETVRFRVNGKAVTSSKGEQRLIDFIRDDLGLTGTKD